MSRTKITQNSIAAGAINANTMFAADIIGPHAIANTSTYSVGELLVGGTILLDNTGIITGPSSITSTAFVGGLTGNVIGNASGTAATVTTAAQPAITSVGTLTSFRSTGIDDNSNALAMTIDSSERVGIGTASPLTELEVADSGAATIRISDSSVSNRRVDLANSGGVAVLTARDGASNAGIFLQGGADGSKYARFIETYIQLYTSNTEKVRIDTNGNVGIGTTAPGSYGKLTVNDTAAKSVYIRSTSTNFSGLLLENTNSSTKWQLGVEGGAYNTAGKLNIGIDGVGPALVIDSSRNVGIGTAAPGTKLSVVSGTNAGISVNDGTVNTILYNSTGPTGSLGTTTNHAMAFYANNAERMRITAAGTVGIGTGAIESGFKLHVVGNGFFSPSSGTVGKVVVDNVDQRLVLGSYYESGVGQYSFISSTNNAESGNVVLAFRTGTTERMRIAAAGNVGIGTTAPQSLLDIGVGSASAPTYKGNIRLLGGALAAHGGLEFQSTTYSSGYGWRIQTPDEGSGSTPIVFQARANTAAWTELLRVTPAGSVGIGTTAPSTALDVVASTSSGNAGIRVRTQYGSGYFGAYTNYPAIMYESSGLKPTFVYDTNNHICQFYTNNGEKMRIDSTGNVGIGTASPAVQTEIQTGSYIGANEVRGLLRLTGQSATENSAGTPSAGTAIEFYNRWTGGTAYSMGRISARGETGYNGGLQFDVSDNNAAGQSNFTTAMSIDPQANVGIGETAPNAKLHVRANDSGSSTVPANTVALFDNNSASIITVRHPSDGGHFSGIAMADNNIGGYVVHGDGTSGDGLHVKGYGYVQINTGASSTVDPNNHSRIASFSTTGLTMYKPGSNTSANIWTDDNVTGMGSYSPQYIWVDNLQVNNWNGGLDRGWADYPSITIQNNTSSGTQSEFRLHGINGVSGGDFSIVLRSDGGFATGSDSRRKTNVESVTNALSIVNQLDGKRFNIINKELEVQSDISTETTGKKFGFIAQDVQSIIPEAVKYYEDEDTPEANGYASAYSMDYASIVPVLTNAIKEQQAMILALTDRIATLEA